MFTTERTTSYTLHAETPGFLNHVDAICDTPDAVAETLTDYSRWLLEELEEGKLPYANNYYIRFEKLGVAALIELDPEQGIATAHRLGTEFIYVTDDYRLGCKAHIEPYALELGNVDGIGSVLQRLAWLLTPLIQQ